MKIIFSIEIHKISNQPLLTKNVIIKKLSRT